jgi:HK97 family phage major capsid protein
VGTRPGNNGDFFTANLNSAGDGHFTADNAGQGRPNGNGGGQGHGQHQGQGAGDPFAAAPRDLQNAVQAARTALQSSSLNAMASARGELETALQGMLTAAQSAGRVLSAEEGQAFDAASQLSDQVEAHRQARQADMNRAGRFAGSGALLDGSPGNRGTGAPADPFQNRQAANGNGRSRITSGGTGTLFRLAGPGGQTHTIRAFRPGERIEAHARATLGLAPDAEDSETTFGGLVKAMATGDFSGLDNLTRSALGEGIGPAGGFLVPTLLSAQIIDLAREQSAITRAGAQTVPMEQGAVTVATVVRDPKPSWRPEHGVIPEDQPVFGSQAMVAKSLAVIVPVSVELLQDAPNIEEILRRLLGAAFSAEIDRAAIAGSGIGPEPTGLVNKAGVPHSLALGGAGDIAHVDQVVRLLHGVRAANAVGQLGVIMHNEHALKIDLTRTPDGALIEAPATFNDAVRVTTNNLPSTGSGATWAAPIIAGVFSDFLIAIRQRLQIEVSRLASPYFSAGQVAIRAMMRADMAVLRPKSFIVREGVKLQ